MRQASRKKNGQEERAAETRCPMKKAKGKGKVGAIKIDGVEKGTQVTDHLYSHATTAVASPPPFT